MTLKKVNNDIYAELGDFWYLADENHYVSILRSESEIKNKWILEQIANHFALEQKLDILDIGCGGGFVSNFLAKNGHNISAIDIHENVLTIAKKYDETKKVNYIMCDAAKTSFNDNSFDVVCALDLLEHVDDYHAVLKEAYRILKKDGIFLFHTFNRNLLTWLFVIKGMEWFATATPKNLHVYSSFIKPSEIKNSLENIKFNSFEFLGLEPVIFSFDTIKKYILRMNIKQKFKLTNKLTTGYIGLAKK